jgi:hypothetical protein
MVVKIGNGHHTCFWLDSWLGNKPLADQFPALYTHVQNPNGKVADSSELGWQLRLRHITSQRAERELLMLLNMLSDISLNKEADVRMMRFRPSKHFFIKACYYAMNFFLGGGDMSGNLDLHGT